MDSSYTYLTTEELAQRIKYDCRTIRQQLKDSVLIEGTPLHQAIWPTENFVLVGSR